jgi:hypothetical protein
MTARHVGSYVHYLTIFRLALNWGFSALGFLALLGKNINLVRFSREASDSPSGTLINTVFR